MPRRRIRLPGALLITLALVPLGSASASVAAAPPLPAASLRLHGLDFGPYIRPGEGPGEAGNRVSRQELRRRLRPLAARTRWVRTFGCDDETRPIGVLAHRHGLEVAVGAWLGPDDSENRRQIDCLIEEARAGNVDLAVVGSEVLLRRDLAEGELTAWLAEVRRSFAAAQLDIPVTTAENWAVLLEHPAVLEAVDLIFVNYHPYWAGIAVEHAVAHVHVWHQALVAAADGKEVVVSETGWPSCGDRVGAAVPSPENAGFYLLNFLSWARAGEVRYFLFEAYDEPWKAEPEGPQGACWGVWDNRMRLKRGMRALFTGRTLPDNWSNGGGMEPIIDFVALPPIVSTNLSTFLVASFSVPDQRVLIDGVEIPADARDVQGNFAVPVPLLEGENLIELVIEEASGGVVSRTTKTVVYDPLLSTLSRRLLYVDVVDLVEGMEQDRPLLDGTIVIDLDGGALLGFLPNRHAVAIAPSGREIYTRDGTVHGTARHEVLRTLPFSQALLSNGFAVSPDGQRLYARDEIVDVATNELLPERLPRSIATAGSWSGAPIPGDPAISADGRFLYCCSDLAKIDIETLQVVGLRGASLNFETDIALTADEDRVLLADYSFASGRLKAYDPFDPTLLLGSLAGLGDFAGEITLSASGAFAVVGSAGNASSLDGRLSVVDLASFQLVDQEAIPLGDNLATSSEDEFFVASGQSVPVPRLGVQEFALGPGGTLSRTRTFFLGVNRGQASSGKPRNDRIRRIVFKPGIFDVIFRNGFESGDTSGWTQAVP